LLQAGDVLQARFAESEQAQARAAAAGGLFEKAWWLLRDGQSEAAILISDQLIVRLEMRTIPSSSATSPRSCVRSRRSSAGLGRLPVGRSRCSRCWWRD